MFDKAKKFVKRNKKKLVMPVSCAIMSVTTAVSAFAAETNAAYSVTSETLAPLTKSINNSLSELIPIGITLMATMIGISLIRRVVYSFI